MITRPSPAVGVTLLVAGSLAAEYLWNPHVNGDQPWAMRRFIPAVLPLCALLAAVGLAAAWDAVRAANPKLGEPVLAVVAVLALLAFPIGDAAPVRALTIEQHFPTAIHTVCVDLGPNAAILTVSTATAVVYTQSLRDWCDVPVAALSGRIDAATMQGLARGWKAQGRTLWVLGDTQATVRSYLPARAPRFLASAISLREIELTLARRPQQYVQRTVTFWGTPVLQG